MTVENRMIEHVARPWVKIKYDLGGGEIVNGYARILPHDGVYHLVFADGQGYDAWANFNPVTRCFYGAT